MAIIADALTPEKALNVSEWADRYRILPQVSAGEPGPWRTSRTPYLREIMDSMSPIGGHERTVFIKPAQIGGSESLLNLLGFIIHQAPGPVLMVQPTVELAARFSKQRVAPMIESVPDLRARVSPVEERNSGNTISAKAFPGGLLILAGSNSAAGLRSMPARYVILDEVDSYPMAAMGAAGAEGGAVSEGDPCDLAIARSETFPNRRVVMISTPTVQGISRIEQAYSESDQRKYNVPCPHCGAFQVLRWAQVKWPEGEPDKAVYECISCRKAIEDHHKPGILQRGQWRAEVVGDGHTAGFWLNGLYSPWNTWARLAKTFLRASKSPERLRVFVNTVLAETWEDPSTEKLEISELMPRREPITEPLPAGIALLTAGIDVQQDRLEAAVYGWGADEECWLIGYYVIRGDTTRPEVWNDLDKLLTRNWKHEFGISLHVNATCIDSGYASGTVYGFCRPRYNRKVYAIKGRAGRYPVWPRKVSHGKDRSLMFLVGVDPCKDWIAPHLRIAQPGPGYMHFPLTVDQTFFEQLGSERVRIRYTHGYAVREWFKAPGARNEALDATCYAYAALQSLVVGGMKLNSYAEKVEAMRKAEGTPTPDKSAQSEGKRDPWYYDHRASGCSNWLGNRGRGWLDRHR